MTNKLYIIGNGFDLHHELKSKYCHFACYLKRNNTELYELLKNYIEFPEPDKDLWSDFESNLANLNKERILFDYDFLLPDFTKEELTPEDREAFPYTMEEYLCKLTEGLIENFQNFISEIKIAEISNELILEIDKKAKYLTFNYTNTLELFYNIDKENVLYIHNSAYYGPEQIILGHGIDPKNFEEELPEPPDDIELEDLEKWYSQNVYWEYSYSTGKDTIMKYFAKNYKPTKLIIEINQPFFSELHSINEIYILGHSLSKVDLPYFEEIIKSVHPGAKWFTSYHNTEKVESKQNNNNINEEKNNSEGKKHLDTLINLGIDKSSISLFQLKEIQLNFGQLKLNFE